MYITFKYDMFYLVVRGKATGNSGEFSDEVSVNYAEVIDFIEQKKQ